jgi:hypothetical protein
MLPVEVAIFLPTLQLRRAAWDGARRTNMMEPMARTVTCGPKAMASFKHDHDVVDLPMQPSER